MNSYNGFSPTQRTRAQKWLNEQWEYGLLKRPTVCCACNQDKGIIHAHAENYNEPFGSQTDEYHLCYRCHIILHCRFNNPSAWIRYKKLLIEGWIWEPIYRNDFELIKKFLNGGDAPSKKGDVRVLIPFDKIGI